MCVWCTLSRSGIHTDTCTKNHIIVQSIVGYSSYSFCFFGLVWSLFIATLRCRLAQNTSELYNYHCRLYMCLCVCVFMVEAETRTIRNNCHNYFLIYCRRLLWFFTQLLSELCCFCFIFLSFPRDFSIRQSFYCFFCRWMSWSEYLLQFFNVLTRSRRRSFGLCHSISKWFIKVHEIYCITSHNNTIV